jgi:hypothetical protein
VVSFVRGPDELFGRAARRVQSTEEIIMSLTVKHLAPALVSVSLAAVIVAQAPAVNVKLGLWEVTSATDMGSLTGFTSGGSLTPEQQAKTESLLGALGPGASAPPRQVCITKEKLEKDPFVVLWSAPGRSNNDCKPNVTAHTDNSIDGTVTCKGGSTPNQAHLEVVSPTDLKGTLTGTNEMRGRSMSVKVSATGKWIADSCGKIK